MPVIKRPRTNDERNQALTKAKQRKDVSPPAQIPYTGVTITRIDAFQPTYKGLMDAVKNALATQTGITALVAAARILAGYFVADIIDALQRAIRRSTFTPNVRAFYGLPVNKPLNPEIRTEEQVLEWGPKAITGETDRIAAGGAPITFPSLAEVTAAYESFRTQNIQQAALKTAYDNAQETVAAQNPEADKLILKMWNETETFFDEGDKASMRRKAREWGVMYIPLKGEAPSPDDFSIIGKVVEQGTDHAIKDAVVKIVETGDGYLSEPNGDYFIPVLPPGNYTLEASKTGYQTLIINNVAVSEGVINEQDIELITAIATGSVSGIVRQTAIPVSGATVTVDGLLLPPVVTNPAGEYTIENIPPGLQNIRAQIGGGMMQTQPVTITAGSETALDFNF